MLAVAVDPDNRLISVVQGVAESDMCANAQAEISRQFCVQTLGHQFSGQDGLRRAIINHKRPVSIAHVGNFGQKARQCGRVIESGYKNQDTPSLAVRRAFGQWILRKLVKSFIDQ
jgi:hypothetical protein